MNDENKASSHEELSRLITIVKTLRDPEKGCPWDLEQTHESLLKFLVEEAYEFMDATKEKDISHMEEELGDLLLQILLHTTIAEQQGSFNLESVAKKLADKLVYRHPHVFKNNENESTDNKISSQEVLEKWEELKKNEKGRKNSPYYFKHKDILYPSLHASFKIGKKAEKIHFDWEHYDQIIYKIEEEWQELKEELPARGQYNRERVEDEIGDLLFSVAQLARKLKMDPEEILRNNNKKFIRRFNKIEDMLISDNLDVKEQDLDTLEQYWHKVKVYERQEGLRK